MRESKFLRHVARRLLPKRLKFLQLRVPLLQTGSIGIPAGRGARNGADRAVAADPHPEEARANWQDHFCLFRPLPPSRSSSTVRPRPDRGKPAARPPAVSTTGRGSDAMVQQARESALSAYQPRHRASVKYHRDPGRPYLKVNQPAAPASAARRESNAQRR
ncbi:hypothetical protein HPB50_018059 [Hyalomma asiaticum]|uniref:Uncharacterized protein n=1 Tax=Hyalomma asiaticum TaxID=266040 RepID=A0ACB7TJY9_HYAAI|nr:hypothetical protein HPB50_018059 [Hyalomma asiaticum]